MKNWPSLAAILAAVGALGLVQVKLVAIAPSLWVRIAIGVAFVIAVSCAWLYTRATPRAELPGTFESLERNRARRRRQPYVVTSKALFVRIHSGRSVRRDAHVRWEMELHNRSRQPLGAIELPLLGEVPISASDLVVSGRAGEHSVALEADVDRGDRISPIVTISPPAPGLRSGDTLWLSFEYVWPAVAHIGEDCWVIDLLRLVDSARVGVVLSFPAADAQFADVRVVARKLGQRRSRAIGRLEPRRSESHSLVELSYIKHRNDELLVIRTRAVA